MNKIKTKHNKVVTNNYVLFKNFRFQKALSLLMSLLLAFSPIAGAVQTDYLIGTLGNSFIGQLEGGAALFEIEAGRIGTEAESAEVFNQFVEMAGNIVKINAGAGASGDAYFVVDRGLRGDEISLTFQINGFLDVLDANNMGWQIQFWGDSKYHLVYGKEETGDNNIDKIDVDVLLNNIVTEDFDDPDDPEDSVEITFTRDAYTGKTTINILKVGGGLVIKNLNQQTPGKAMKLTATITGSHTVTVSADGEIDGRMNKYDELRTVDNAGVLWRTFTTGIRGGDVVNSTTYNGYDPLVKGQLSYTYTFGETNGAVSNYVESFTYNSKSLVETTTRSGMVGGDIYGDGNLITDEAEDYVTTNVYRDDENGETVLSGISVAGDINGRKSSFLREFVYDSLGRTVETSYDAIDKNAADYEAYALVNGAFYGGSLPTEKYKESTKYNSDGSVASTIIEGRIDGMKNSYTQSFQYTGRGQVYKTITNGTVRGNTYNKIEETNLIKNKDSINRFTLASDINSGRTMASITNGTINGAVSDVVTRYDYDNDGIEDDKGRLNPFDILLKDRVGRQLATYTRGVRDATYYGDGETVYILQDEEGDRVVNAETYFENKMMDSEYSLSADVDENVSFVSFSEYNKKGQVKKTITGIRIVAVRSENPLAQDEIQGGMINGTENYYATVYKYDEDGLGREKETATRGIRGGRFYGVFDGDNTVENLTWEAGVEGEVESGADYVEANTYYDLDDDTIDVDINGNGSIDDGETIKYADTHLFRLKSTHTTGWTDGEANDYVRLLDYDNDGVGITWNGGNLSGDDVLASWDDTDGDGEWELGEKIIITGTSQEGDGRVTRTLTSGMVSARCYGNACDGSTAENFDLKSVVGKDFNFSFANDTADIYQEVNSYDSQGRVVFAKNLGLINSAKDNYRIDYFYDTGAITGMAGRQVKSVINSKAIEQGSAVVSASVRINYVEETDYDDEDKIDLNRDGTTGPQGRGLRTAVKVTGYDSGAFNDYVQLFEYQDNTDSINYESIAGRMSLVSYRGMRGSSVNGFIADPKTVPLNTALNKLEDTSIWNKSADFIQRLFYAGASDAEHRAGQQTRIDTEGTLGGSSNSYTTLNAYDSLGRQKERRIQGEHAFSKLNLIQAEAGSGDTDKVDWDINNGSGFGIVGGQFTKTNERMEYFANGQLKWIINEGGFSETVEDGNIYGGQDNNKRVFSYDNAAKDDNDFYGRDAGFSYDVVDPNGEEEAPRVGGNFYYGFNKIIEETPGGNKKLSNECSENCNYEIKYIYDAKGQRETQHSWGWIINRADTPESSSDIRNTAQLDEYTTTFKYNNYGQTFSTSYNTGAILRGNTYGVAPVDKTGRKLGADGYVTTYSYNDLGWQTKQQSVGYRGESGKPNFDNFTRTNLLEYTFADKFKLDESDPESPSLITTGKTYRNNWGRVIDSRLDGIYGGANYKNQSQNFSADALRLSLFDGFDDGKDPLGFYAGDDDNPFSYKFEAGEAFMVYEDFNDDGKIDKNTEGKQYYIKTGKDDEIVPNNVTITTAKAEFLRRVKESVAGKLITLPDEVEVDYGDMYKGSRPCVRQTDGTLNCAH